jgi:hypothetical protein
MRLMWTQPAPTFHGQHYRIEKAYCEPRYDPPPPVMIGGGGEKLLLPLAARRADIWDSYHGGTIEDIDLDAYRRKLDILRRHAAEAGRDPGVPTQSYTIENESLPETREESARWVERLRPLVHLGVRQFILGFGHVTDTGLVERFAEAASRGGIGPGVFVVAYGSLGGAERLWWLLRHFGHDDCAVIDLGDWRGPLRGGEETAPRAAFEPAERRDDTIGREELASGRDGLVVVDARLPSRWRGEPNPVDRVPGRIRFIEAIPRNLLRSLALRCCMKHLAHHLAIGCGNQHRHPGISIQSIRDGDTRWRCVLCQGRCHQAAKHERDRNILHRQITPGYVVLKIGGLADPGLPPGPTRHRPIERPHCAAQLWSQLTTALG